MSYSTDHNRRHIPSSWSTYSATTCTPRDFYQPRATEQSDSTSPKIYTHIYSCEGYISIDDDAINAKEINHQAVPTKKYTHTHNTYIIRRRQKFYRRISSVRIRWTCLDKTFESVLLFFFFLSVYPGKPLLSLLQCRRCLLVNSLQESKN